MKSHHFNVMLLLIVFCLSLFMACGGEKNESAGDSQVIVPEKKIVLWNGKDFEGWTRFIPEKDVDVNTVWMVKEGLLHCTGSPNGYIRTNNNYADYELTVEWRWPAEAGNSGVLLHMSEPDVVWPKSIEAQLMSENAGDFWVIGGTSIKELTDPSERRIEKKEPSSENQPGEWNTYKIICQGDRIELRVNDVLQNTGTEATVQSGKICLQSEGKPIEFRAIYLQPLN